MCVGEGERMLGGGGGESVLGGVSVLGGRECVLGAGGGGGGQWRDCICLGGLGGGDGEWVGGGQSVCFGG